MNIQNHGPKAMEIYRVVSHKNCKKTKWGKSQISLSFSTGTSGNFFLSEKQFNNYVKVLNKLHVIGTVYFYVVLRDGYFVWCSEQYKWMIDAFKVPKENVYVNYRPNLDGELNKMNFEIDESLLDA